MQRGRLLTGTARIWENATRFTGALRGRMVAGAALFALTTGCYSSNATAEKDGLSARPAELPQCDTPADSQRLADQVLQLVNLEIRSLVLSKGATPKAIQGNFCNRIDHVRGLWYKEQLLIENAKESLPDEIIKLGVIHLLKKIDRAIILGADLPETLLMPDELQVFIDTLCKRYGSLI